MKLHYYCFFFLIELEEFQHGTPKAKDYWSILGSLTFCSPTGNRTDTLS